MKKLLQERLNQVNRDIIFFFLLVVSSGISFYVINEKKKSILGIDCIDSFHILETITVYIVNKATKNMGVQIPLCDPALIVFDIYPEMGLLDHIGNFNFHIF